ncbi:hypothetical protein HPB47_009960 [Ixodes persulcatus]|uniref:Uncharacterized protein n=1 Tax=Ixodes persulcatus TaxID=34615 RepID=A0AC60P0D3_IXOPE|nr:hypothetical protein HPB47_009960 [Ixodes persulcatus]
MAKAACIIVTGIPKIKRPHGYEKFEQRTDVRARTLAYETLSQAASVKDEVVFLYQFPHSEEARSEIATPIDASGGIPRDLGGLETESVSNRLSFARADVIMNQVRPSPRQRAAAASWRSPTPLQVLLLGLLPSASSVRIGSAGALS